MKKVLLVILFIVILGAGIGGTVYFYIQNKNQIEQNMQLTQQNASIQSQLDQIGQMTEVYEVYGKVFGGNQIKQEDLMAVSIPVSACGDSSITDMSELVGKFYKIDIKPGTILTRDMIMEQTDDTGLRYTRDILLDSVPVTLQVGDYVDFRIMLPNGEDYVVMSHKRVELLYETTVTVKVTEEEQTIWNSALIDLATYGQYGCVLYMTKYLEPGVDTDTIGTYPIQHDAENWVRFNPNIKDTTRCINTTLRDHIDEILFVYSTQSNNTVTSGISAIFSTHMAAQVATQQLWLQEFYDEENDTMTWPGFDQNVENVENGVTPDNFDDTVNDTMGGLEEDLGEIGGIQ